MMEKIIGTFAAGILFKILIRIFIVVAVITLIVKLIKKIFGRKDKNSQAQINTASGSSNSGDMMKWD